MYKAIETKYFGQTNYLPSRIIARAEGGARQVASYAHELDASANHLAAAQALAVKMKWSGEYVGGATRNGYAWVNLTGARTAVEPGSFVVADTVVSDARNELLTVLLSEGDMYEELCAMGRRVLPDSDWFYVARDYMTRLRREGRYNGPLGLAVQHALGFAARDHFFAHVRES